MKMENAVDFQDLATAFKNFFREAEITEDKTWCSARFSANYPSQVHYELIQRGNLYFVEFHLEMKNFELAKKINNILPLRDYARFTYYASQYWQARKPVMSVEDLIKEISTLRNATISCVSTDAKISGLDDSSSVPVGVCKITLTELLKQNLCIPEYQRGYCWRIRNVRDLLDDIVKWQSTHTGGDDVYHLGTVILHAIDNPNAPQFEIIDGQQRLTTLAIWQYLKIDGNNPPSLLNSTLRCNNLTNEVTQAILRAKNTIEGYQKEDINFAKIILSVVVIDKDQPQDLSYTFFSNSNSTGKRLSDYDLLKTHHLRYIEGETIARKMVERWHSLEKSGKQDELLHQTLFRLRNWRSGTPFRLNASDTPERDVFRHYAVNLDSLKGFHAFSLQPFRFDSILGGGNEFFHYVEYYRKRYADFAQQEVVKKLYDSLSWHSHGVLHAGIRAIAFLFYCKFGDLYLTDAVYVLVYHLSRLRNEAQVRGAYLASSLFQESTSCLDRVTTEGEFFAAMLDPRETYTVGNNGRTANNYWKSVYSFLTELEKNSLSIPKQYFKSTLFSIEEK